jgi:hypothetical protein
MRSPIAIGLLALLAAAPVTADTTPPPPKVEGFQLNQYAYLGALQLRQEFVDAGKRDMACVAAVDVASLAYWQRADSPAYKLALGYAKGLCSGGQPGPGGK